MPDRRTRALDAGTQPIPGDAGRKPGAVTLDLAQSRMERIGGPVVGGIVTADVAWHDDDHLVCS